LAAVAKRYAADPTVGRSKAAAVRSAYAGRTPAEVDEARARLHPGGLKQCRRCRTWQRFTAFATSRYNADSLNTDCRRCIAARNRETRGPATRSSATAEAFPQG
jgi:heterodisulfide reductase subunit A-like polyferredoxin